MMNFKVTCPGKVFILGEYSCLEGGPALVGTLEPCFMLEIGRKENNRQKYSKHSSHDDDGLSTNAIIPFAPESPAGRFLIKNFGVIQEYKFQWHDPYQTPIGVGSSSAQFILAVAALAKLKDERLPEASKVLNMYWETVGECQGLRPSGVDVVAQWMGGPCVVQTLDDQQITTESLSVFSSSNTEFLLAYTGSKLKTHEHLLELQKLGFPKFFSKTLKKLSTITQTGVKTWRETNPHDLGLALWEYQVALTEAGIASKDLSLKLEALLKIPGVLGCKGSGAQGGDCVLFLIEKSESMKIIQEIKNIGWQPLRISWTTHGVQL